MEPKDLDIAPQAPPVPPCIPGNRVGSAIAATTTFTVIATILLLMRIFVRLKILTKSYGWDDTFIILSWVISIASFSLVLLMTSTGFGRHLGCVDMREFEIPNKSLYIANLFFVLSPAFSRLSICIFLLRLFSIDKIWRWTLWMVACVSTASNVALTLFLVFQCNPPKKVWMQNIEGECWSQRKLVSVVIAQGSLSGFLDLILTFLPIYAVGKIRMSAKLKLGVSALLSLGFVTAICAVMRNVSANKIPGSRVEDFTWSGTPLIIWSSLESNMAIIVANIPTIRPLFRKSFWKTWTNRRSSKYNELHDPSLQVTGETPQRSTAPATPVDVIALSPRAHLPRHRSLSVQSDDCNNSIPLEHVA